MAQVDSLGKPGSILFARASGEELQRDIATISNSAVVDGILVSVGAVFAVLNGYRQIIA